MPCGRESRPGCVSALRVGHGVPRRLAVSSRLKNGQPPAVLLLRKPQVGAPWPANVLQPLESGCPDSSFPSRSSERAPASACLLCVRLPSACSVCLGSDPQPQLPACMCCGFLRPVCVSCNRPALVLPSALLYIGTEVFPWHVCYKRASNWMLLALLHPTAPLLSKSHGMRAHPRARQLRVQRISMPWNCPPISVQCSSAFPRSPRRGVRTAPTNLACTFRYKAQPTCKPCSSRYLYRSNTLLPPQ